MTVTRGTSNKNARGSSKDRRARRRWLVATYGDGVTVACYRCRAALTEDTVTADRIVPGWQGGTYVRSNLRPACITCNAQTGGADAGLKAARMSRRARVRHVLVNDHPACNPGGLLDVFVRGRARELAKAVPAELRCKRQGCAERWPTVPA